MRDFQLSKYGFRLKLQGVLKVTSWCGLIYHVIVCAIGLCLFFIPEFLPQYLNSRIQFLEYVDEPHIRLQSEPYQNIYHFLWHDIPDGVSTLVAIYINLLKDTMKCVGAVLTIWSVAWFGFFLVLRRNLAKKDIFEIRNLLAKSTFIIGGIFNGVNLVIIFYLIIMLDILDSGSGYTGYDSGFKILLDMKIGGTCCCLFMLLCIIMVILNSIMMNGVFHRKSKPVEVFIIFIHIIFILWALGLLIGTAGASAYLRLPWVLLAGFILLLLSFLVYTLNISIILCLHSIILSSSTEINNLPIFSRGDKQIMDDMLNNISDHDDI